MTSTTLQPEGSNQSIKSRLRTDTLTPAFECETAGSNWACGMPLSYVQEMASLWLSAYNGDSQLDNSARPDFRE